MTLPPYTREGEFYRDADGYDVAQDERWEQVDPSGFHSDPSLEEWPRPLRVTTLQKSPVCREDFDPAGLAELSEVPRTSPSATSTPHGTRRFPLAGASNPF